ncbi:SPASM domain-containing protein [candidate division CSSED10-310 bacterium]|uniref:SPASM domain-containing protein n=1 Tax=candidate division CSSED10-310 bacterium TaxID=2855610 RepID=A0ABV6YSY3_UNCC1
MEWTTFQSILKLDHRQTIIIEYLINRLKDHFTDICDTLAVDYDLSPIEYHARIKVNDPDLDDFTVEKKLVEYLWKKHMLGTNSSYVQYFTTFSDSTFDEIQRLLTKEQKKVFYDKIENLLDINTGYEPIRDKLWQQLIKDTDLKSLEDSAFLCLIPFEFAYIENNGDVFPCCPSKFSLSIGNLLQTPLLEIWNSQAADAVRKSIVNRTFRFCDHNTCEYLRNLKFRLKQETKSAVSDDLKTEHLLSKATTPKVINLAHDLTCNLSCPQCRAEIYKPGELFHKNLQAIHENIFCQKLPGLERLIMAGNGEPLASRFYLDFLQNFEHQKFPAVKIKIQTNGLLFTPALWERIAKSHRTIDVISVSLDAATEKTYHKIRGGNFKQLLSNLDFISTLRKHHTIEKFLLNFVVQADNFREMKQFVNLGLALQCDLIEFQCLENWGTYSPEEFNKIAIHLTTHLEHQEFLKIVVDPIFQQPAVSLFKLLDFMPDSLKKKWTWNLDLVKY